MNENEILIIGSKGQLGSALKEKYPNAQTVDIDELDITNPASLNGFDWMKTKTILNAAAFTNVDRAETPEGRELAWKVNATALANLARIAYKFGITLVHISSDYVFDGTKTLHSEEEAFSPINVYGASKAAGDLAVSVLKQYYILRTSWVIGEGKNFVRTMLDVGRSGTAPTVVSDQIGRLTFTSELVRAIDYLLVNRLEYGTYNVSNSGESVSWADITRQIYKLADLDLMVTDITTGKYFNDKPEAAPRPLNSTLDLTKMEKTGFTFNDWRDDLTVYVAKELRK